MVCIMADADDNGVIEDQPAEEEHIKQGSKCPCFLAGRW